MNINKKEVAEHLEKLNVEAVMVTPSHEERSESAEFRRTKQQLREDKKYKCWICGCTEMNKLQVHHFWGEWSESNIVDFDVLTELCNSFDIYGYSKLLYGTPVTQIDDIRQMMILCAEHHTGTDSTDGGTSTAIHGIPFSYWVMQKLGKVNPIPQEGFTIEQTEDAIEKYQNEEEK